MTVGLAQEDAEERLAVGTARLLLLLEQSGRDFSAFGLSQHEGSPPLVVPDTREGDHEKGTVTFSAR